MAVLSDRDILARMKDHSIVDPFEEANLTPNGIDLRINEIMFDGEVQPEGKFTLHPGKWMLVSTTEVIDMPGDLVGNLWLRSSWVRKGMLTSFGVVDSGFNGTLTMSGFNAGLNPIEISTGDRYVQMIMIELAGEVEKAYAERSGSYQGQRGITTPLGDSGSTM